MQQPHRRCRSPRIPADNIQIPRGAPHCGQPAPGIAPPQPPLVDTRKDGRHIIYSLRDGHLIRLIHEAINHADHVVTGEARHG